jgi:hypothetical protein
VQEPVERLLRSLEVVGSGRASTAIRGACGPEPGLDLHAGSGKKPLLGRDPGFDFECPLMSLPAAFHTTLENVLWPGPYLFAEPAAVEEKRAAFPSLQPGLRVGLAWAGNPRYKADRQRSLRLEILLPLLRSARSVNWISLQKADTCDHRGGEKADGDVNPIAAQIAALPPDVQVLDGSSCDRDLAETAALVSTLDLVISTDTSIAHLAGAMGKPVWILLPALADWRWMQDRETTPWYPTARLFRQHAPGDWPELLERVRHALTYYQ